VIKRKVDAPKPDGYKADEYKAGDDKPETPSKEVRHTPCLLLLLLLSVQLPGNNTQAVR
jgi:hypothetical protein